MLIRVVALGLVIFSGLITWLEFLRERTGKGPVRSGILVLFGLLAVAGLGLLVCSGSLARRWTEDFDE